VTRDDDFLSRWSRRKHAVRRGDEVEEAAPKAGDTPSAPAVTAPAQPPKADAPLPPVEALTPESDFAPFMRDEVDPVLRRQALKTLFRDPRFNVMDGLDVYIADFSQPDPIPPEWLGQLRQMAHLGDCAPSVADPVAPEEPTEASEAAPILAANQEVEPDPASPLPEDPMAGSPPRELKES
jgi:hypothetical protein